MKFKLAIDTDVVLTVSQVRAKFSIGDGIFMRVRSVLQQPVSKAIVHNGYAINSTTCWTHRLSTVQ
jgi:hypothetical protein